MDYVKSHGRGGAGNIGKDDGGVTPKDLETPALKADQYTTGRGGVGNMATNDRSYPEIARAAQDVKAAVHNEKPGQSFHYGRGGAANVGVTADTNADDDERTKRQT